MKTPRDSVAELQQLSFQLRSLAHLLSVTGGTGDEHLEQIHWGLGMILARLCKQAMRVAREVERIELSRTIEN